MTRFCVAAALRRGDFILDVAIDLDARLLALTGPSGSGKTTLLQVIAGLTSPERGRVQVGETVLLDTGRGHAMPAHRRRIGYVFQDGRLFPHLTVEQNLDYGRFFSPDKASPDEKATILGLLAIAPLLRRRVGSLSGGERQRVAIGRALLAKPRLLLMDEPFAALDEARRQDLLPLIEDIRDRAGVPIVYVSHNGAEVARLADRVVVIRDGRMVTPQAATPATWGRTRA